MEKEYGGCLGTLMFGILLENDPAFGKMNIVGAGAERLCVFGCICLESPRLLSCLFG